MGWEGQEPEKFLHPPTIQRINRSNDVDSESPSDIKVLEDVSSPNETAVI